MVKMFGVQPLELDPSDLTLGTVFLAFSFDFLICKARSLDWVDPFLLSLIFSLDFVT